MAGAAQTLRLESQATETEALATRLAMLDPLQRRQLHELLDFVEQAQEREPFLYAGRQVPAKSPKKGAQDIEDSSYDLLCMV